MSMTVFMVVIARNWTHHLLFMNIAEPVFAIENNSFKICKVAGY